MSRFSEPSIRLSVPGFSRLGTMFAGKCIVFNCPQEQRDALTGDEGSTYQPQPIWIRCTQDPEDANSYKPAFTFHNDVEILCKPPITAVTAKNSFFDSKVTEQLQNQLSAIDGPAIDKMVLEKVTFGETVATQQGKLPEFWEPEYDVQKCTYHFVPLKGFHLLGKDISVLDSAIYTVGEAVDSAIESVKSVAGSAKSAVWPQ